MLQLWKARQGRKAAIAMLGPLIEKSEASLGGIPAAAWHDPYILGFISMLASLEARAAVGGNLGSTALGLIQSETMAELSGALASLHGEEILTLSMDGDPQFQRGCSQAVSFHTALRRSHLVPIGTGAGSLWSAELLDPRDDVFLLWLDMFQEKVAVLS
jgi:hypothetical protein